MAELTPKLEAWLSALKLGEYEELVRTKLRAFQRDSGVAEPGDIADLKPEQIEGLFSGMPQLSAEKLRNVLGSLEPKAVGNTVALPVSVEKTVFSYGASSSTAQEVGNPFTFGAATPSTESKNTPFSFDAATTATANASAFPATQSFAASSPAGAFSFGSGSAPTFSFGLPPAVPGNVLSQPGADAEDSGSESGDDFRSLAVQPRGTQLQSKTVGANKLSTAFSFDAQSTNDNVLKLLNNDSVPLNTVGVDLSNCTQVSDEGFSDFVCWCVENLRLQQIFVGKTKIGGKSLGNGFTLLGSSLTEINIANTHLGVSGAKCVAAGLKECKVLLSINIAGTDLVENFEDVNLQFTDLGEIFEGMSIQYQEQDAWISYIHSDGLIDIAWEDLGGALAVADAIIASPQLEIMKFGDSKTASGKTPQESELVDGVVIFVCGDDSDEWTVSKYERPSESQKGLHYVSESEDPVCVAAIQLATTCPPFTLNTDVVQLSLSAIITNMNDPGDQVLLGSFLCCCR
jgi:hypothetical protein